MVLHVKLHWLTPDINWWSNFFSIINSSVLTALTDFSDKKRLIAELIIQYPVTRSNPVLISRQLKTYCKFLMWCLRHVTDPKSEFHCTWVVFFGVCVFVYQKNLWLNFMWHCLVLASVVKLWHSINSTSCSEDFQLFKERCGVWFLPLYVSFKS